MEKTVTKEEVERVALKHINGVIVDKILNELFSSFKAGDWVVGWHSSFKELTHNAWKIDYFDKHGRVVPVGKKGYATSIESLRHATPEEIAAAEWEEGKVYRVWHYDEWRVRVSAKEVGCFYLEGSFEGFTRKHIKYEKL